MVSKKSSKNAKFTYAERVLGAISQVQKEHKKHSIHIATLRAQVKKNAQAKKDRLGPHWSKWVGKTVHNLEDDGILEPSGDVGSVSLTPNGKKAISTARRTLRLSDTDVDSISAAGMDWDDLVWKRVSQLSKQRGTKRRDIAHGEFASAVSKSKRHRRSSSDPKPVSRKTKAELIRELESLKAVTQSRFSRESSPLTHISDEGGDEAMRLKTVLKEREVEVETLRCELEEARKRYAGQDVRSEVTSRFATPQSIFCYATPPQTIMNHDRSLLTRTRSGSYIPHISKQPAPAPSINDADFDNEHCIDRAGPQAELLEGIAKELERDANRPVASLATPVSTPPRAVLVPEEDSEPLQVPTDLRTMKMHKLEDEVSKLRMRYSRAEQQLSYQDTRIPILQATICDLQNAMRDKTSTLRLESDNEIKHLKELLHQSEVIISRYAEKENATSAGVEAERSRADALQTNNETHLTTISTLEREVKDLQVEKGILAEELSRTLASRLAASQGLAEAEEHNKSLIQLLTSASQNVDDLRNSELQKDVTIRESKASLSDVRKEVMSLQDKVTSMDAIIGSTRAENVELRDNIGKLEKKMVEIEIDTSRLSVQLQDAEDRAAGATRSVAQLKITLDSYEAQRIFVEERFEQSNRKVLEISSELQKEKEHSEKLGLQLSHKEDDLVGTRQHAAMMESMAAKFKTENAIHDKTLTTLRSEVERLQNELSASETSLFEARTIRAEKFALAEATILDLNRTVMGFKKQIYDLTGKLALEEEGKVRIKEELQKQVTTLQRDLNQEEDRRGVLEAELKERMMREEEMEEEILGLISSKRDDEITIKELQTSFSHLRNAEMRLLAEVENKIVSAHPSPAPARRVSRIVNHG